jgi:hypothetical protein
VASPDARNAAPFAAGAANSLASIAPAPLLVLAAEAQPGVAVLARLVWAQARK